MKIALATIHSKTYLPLADITWSKNRLVYSQIHGYEPVVRSEFGDLILNPQTLGFEKIRLIRDLLVNHNFDMVYWCGCDTLITNFTIKLESFLYDGFDITIAPDFNVINADSFLVRNSPFTISWLDRILSFSNSPHYLNHPWGDNAVIVDIYPEFQSKIKVVPQKFMNSYPYDIFIKQYNLKNSCDRLGLNGNWSKGDFLIHFPSLQFDYRIELCKHYLTQVVY